MAEYTTTRSLAILLSQDSISYRTKTLKNGETTYSAIMHYKVDELNKNKSVVELEYELKSNLVLLLTYDYVHICFLSPSVNVVPTVFLEKPYEQFLSLSAYQPVLLAIDSPLKEIDASLVYNIHYPLKDVLLSLPNLQNAQLYHSGKLLIDHIQASPTADEIHINRVHQALEIACFSKGQFVFYNIFDTNAEEDFLFYVVYTLNQLNFNQHEVHCYIYGDTLPHSNYHHTLQKYIRHLHFLNEDEKAQHFTFNKLFECELYQEL